MIKKTFPERFCSLQVDVLQDIFWQMVLVIETLKLFLGTRNPWQDTGHH